jgi:hypothetical protein
MRLPLRALEITNGKPVKPNNSNARLTAMFGFSGAQLSRVHKYAVMAMILCCGGCALFGPPAVPPKPALDFTASAYVGSPMSGPTAGTVPVAAAADGLQIDVQWNALQAVPAEGLSPLDTQSDLTIAPLAAGPILTVGRMTRIVRFGVGDSAVVFSSNLQGGKLGQSALVMNQSGLIVPGATVRFHCQTPGDPVHRFTLGVSQVNGGTIAIGVEGLASAKPTGESTENSPAAGAGPETAFLENLNLTGGSHFVVLIPCKIEGTPWNAIVAGIDVKGVSSDDASAAALGKLHDELTASTQLAQSAGSIPPLRQPELQRAINALSRSDAIRPPLLFLATTTNAAIATDFILVADDPQLAMLRDEIVQFASAKPNLPALDELAWFMDRSAVLLMTGQAAKNTLAPELASVLVLHAGEVGRNPDSLEEIVKSVTNFNDLEQRLIGENYIALEDNSPGARVRAFDWLKTQGKAPAGYDPLGDAKSRRTAINNALAASGGAQ